MLVGVGGNKVALSITVLATLSLQGVTEVTDKVSLVNPERNVTITAVSFAPKAFTCVIVALVPTFNTQLYEVA